MNTRIKIIFLLIVCPNLLFGQTYFNQRYAPDSGNWGGGAFSVVPTDTNYFISRWSRDNLDGKIWNKISRLDVAGGFIDNSDSIHYLDRDHYVRGFKECKGGFVQAVTVRRYNPIFNLYGIVKYDSTGVSYLHKIDTTPYIYNGY